MAGQWSQYLNRSAQVFKDNVGKLVFMKGADLPSRAPLPLLALNTPEDLKGFATGCDSDVGGRSTAKLELDTNPKRLPPGKSAVGRFWGEMRLDVQPGKERTLRSGYAGFRSMPRPTLFGEMLHNVSYHDYLALRVRAGGDPRTWNSYFVNIQTEGGYSNDLWQHRLYFKRSDGGWEDVYIPFDNFVRKNAGEIARDQYKMPRNQLRTIGVSILGGNSLVAGPYELGIDTISAVVEPSDSAVVEPGEPQQAEFEKQEA
ncbi:complex I intermediate-associated protein 30-domain-containing protein [Schizophyllum commune]